jgi:hypothetical protein
MRRRLLQTRHGTAGRSIKLLAALPDRIGDRSVPITDTQEAAE